MAFAILGEKRKEEGKTKERREWRLKTWKDFYVSVSKLDLKMAFPKAFHRAVDPCDVGRHYSEEKDVTCPNEYGTTRVNQV